MSDQLELQRHALSVLMRPLVRLCLRFGLPAREFEQIARSTFIEIAEEEIVRDGKKPSVCKISVLTGLYRVEVKRISEQGLDVPAKPPTMLSRVAVQWEQSSRFQTTKGTPRVLTCDGEESEFFRLVRTVTKNYHPSSILAEMMRNGMVSQTGGRVKLIRTSQIHSSKDQYAYELVGKDYESLLAAALENLEPQDEIGNLHHRTEFDNVALEAMPTIKRWILEEGRKFHQRARRYISRFDLDLKPTKTPLAGGGRVVLGAYSLTNDGTSEGRL